MFLQARTRRVHGLQQGEVPEDTTLLEDPPDWHDLSVRSHTPLLYSLAESMYSRHLRGEKPMLHTKQAVVSGSCKVVNAVMLFPAAFR
jgi:hypothetical protein